MIHLRRDRKRETVADFFVRSVRMIGAPVPTGSEVLFHPQRKWRFDFASVTHYDVRDDIVYRLDSVRPVAVEIEGGTFAATRTEFQEQFLELQGAEDKRISDRARRKRQERKSNGQSTNDRRAARKAKPKAATRKTSETEKPARRRPVA